MQTGGRFFLIPSSDVANQIATLPAAEREQTPAFPTMTPTGGSLQDIPALVAGNIELPQDSSGAIDLMLLE